MIKFLVSAHSLLPPGNETENRLFGAPEEFFGDDQKFTLNFEINESNLKIDKSKPKTIIKFLIFKYQFFSFDKF